MNGRTIAAARSRSGRGVAIIALLAALALAAGACGPSLPGFDAGGDAPSEANASCTPVGSACGAAAPGRPACCAGLRCCMGAPIQPGREYCAPQCPNM